MKDRRLLWIVGAFMLLQLVSSAMLGKQFYKWSRESVELTNQRMMKDEVPSNLRREVISALGSINSEVRGYVSLSNQVHFTLNLILVLVLFNRLRRE